ncbi:hypothetical protein N9917_00495 [Deltaproteobacteria bacterium]|nr:hypothetical protein [Deltaproteobacteria bacterium]
MAWNDLTPEEFSFVTRLAAAAKAVDEALELRNSILHDHVCRWGEGEPVGVGREPIYATHPTCLLCGQDNDMELYCHVSPIKVCEFAWGDDVLTCEQMLDLWLQDDMRVKPEAAQQLMRNCPCAHCDDIWARSY